jgi:hypothetical protein
MSNFDWRTEEEEWGSLEPETPPARPPRRRRWLALGLVIGLLVVVAGLAGWRLRLQLQQAEGLRTDDVVASYVLVNQAAAEQDSDVLAVVLASSDRVWHRVQRELTEQGLLFQPAAFELWRLPDRARIESIDLAPTLRAADVLVLETYQVGDGQGTGTIQLRRTDQYRRSDRWQWAPPDDDYWQGQAQTQWGGRRLTAYFPPRDQDLSIRLSQDLDELLARLCEGTRNLDCPESLRIQLRLTRESEALLQLASGSRESGYFGQQLPYYAHGLGVTLPAPSLIGRPVDEAAYQALYRGYARHLVAALLAGLLEQPWSNSQVLYDAALRSYLVELGLLPWAAAGEVEAVVQPLPDQDIELLCQNGPRANAALLRLELATMSWWPEWSDGYRLARLVSGPGGQGVILQAQLEGAAVAQNQLVWWHNGEAIFVHTAEGSDDDYFEWQVRQTEGQLVVRVPGQEPGFLTAYLYDLAQCQDQACATRVDRLRGRPLWSPGGSQLLIQASGMLWLRQGSGEQGLTTRRLDEGMIPFWLDHRRFGYVRLSAGTQQDVVVQEPGGEPQVMFTRSDLMAVLPTAARPERLYIGYIDPGPGVGRPWTILALGLLSDGGVGEGGVGEAYLFSYTPAEDRLTLVLQSDYLNSFNVSPDGRWLAATIFETGEQRWNLEIRDTMIGEHRTLPLSRGGRPETPPFYEWSADSQWLLVVSQGRLVLYSLASGQQHILTPPTPGCVQAVWLNRDESG